MMILSIFSSVILGILLAELILRFLYRLNYNAPLPYGLRANSAKRIGHIKFTLNFHGKNKAGIVYSINSYGYRDDEIDFNKKHILFLGDSTTFGLNINHEDTYPEVLEKMMNASYGGIFQAVNTAVPGQGTFEERDILRSFLEMKRLDIKAVVLGFYCNDFSENSLYHAYMERVKRGGLVFKTVNFVKEKMGTPRLYILFAFFWNKIHPKYFKRESQNVQETPHILSEEEIYKTKSWQLTIEALDGISGLCRQNGIPFIFIYFPSGEEEILSGKSPEYKALLERYLSGMTGIYYVDVLKMYRRYLLENHFIDRLPQAFYSFKGDVKHPGVLACRIIAQELFSVFEKEKIIGDRKHAVYERMDKRL